MKVLSIIRASLVGLACLNGAGTASAALVIDAYLSAPTDQTSYLAGSGTTETFGTTNLTTSSYTSTIGTFTSTSNFKIQPADQYGGAGGTGDYLAFGAQSGNSAPVTITLSTPANYIGIWISAADANNGVSFYSGSTLIGRFGTANLLNLLSGSTVTDVGGATYSSSSYYGNPTTTYSGQNGTQPYGYVDFFGAGGTTFTSIVLDNSGTIGTGFESDNYTVFDGTTTVPTGDVFIVAVPEPSQYAVWLMGVALGLVAGQKLWQKRFQVSPSSSHCWGEVA